MGNEVDGRRVGVPDPGIVEEARRRGFRKGLNVALAGLVVLFTLWAQFRLWNEAPRFREVFVQVKVPVPVLTMVVLEHYGAIGAGLLGLGGACIWATAARGDRPWTMILNIASFLLVMGWLALQSLSLFMPLVSVLEGIRGR